ncbi:hypothetical protein AT2G16019 [Arabidopsis thaliana]|uniref:Uncharacterized protein n=1 Tax=Arabidopsis thaliana TaxID=3702 RepID=B3H5N8_ARATH|nr:uncharacterized protein AT2G16019 [Arabidopsis thaliana]AEC06458.1 hypothetical protein AT2G16019 [Arabidopsis thaliana]|eukprot:NP_001118326.1 hypothetical protein AT2G16019 [Arabidopsis thaliana]
MKKSVIEEVGDGDSDMAEEIWRMSETKSGREEELND